MKKATKRSSSFRRAAGKAMLHKEQWNVVVQEQIAESQ